MASKLSPLPTYRERSYPKVESKMLRSVLLLAGMTATSLGGCGPAIDSRSVDSALDQGDLDGSVDCDADMDAEGCEPSNTTDASTD